MKSLLKHTSTIAILAIILGLGIQSCNSVKPINKASLEGQWTLKTLNGEDAASLFKGAIPSINFDLTENRISGNGGCNLYNGSFTISEKNEFSAPQIATTMMLCMEENQESRFLEELGKSNNIIGINQDSILTFTQDGKIVLEFQKEKVGTTSSAENIQLPNDLYGSWNLISISDGDLKNLFGEMVPTIEFLEDGKASGNSGCNTYNTSYTINGDSISFGLLMSTKMACPNLEGENKYSTLLASPFQVSLKGDTLILSKNNTSVLEFKKTTH